MLANVVDGVGGGNTVKDDQAREGRVGSSPPAAACHLHALAGAPAIELKQRISGVSRILGSRQSGQRTDRNGQAISGGNLPCR